MKISRRELSLGLLSSMGLSLSGRAYADDPRYLNRDITIHNNVINKKSIYDTYANEGEYGLPDRAYMIEPVPGLKLYVYLPPQKKSGSLVVFSHGESNKPESYDNILKHWASHGFVVVAPFHNDVPNDEDLEIGSGGEPLDPLKGLMLNPANWKSRVDLCHQTLDSVSSIEHASGVKINIERPIIAGHSMGSWTAQMMVGLKAKDTKGNDFSSFDERYYAALSLSSFGKGYMGLDENSWDNITRPLMIISGNGDNDAFNEKSENKIDGFYLCPEGNKHLIWFNKLWSSFFIGNTILPDTPMALYFHDILSISTCFMEAYGNYNKEIFDDLVGNYFQEQSKNRLAQAYR